MSVCRVIVTLAGLLPLAMARDAVAVDCSSSRVAERGYVICRVDLRTDHLELVYADDTGTPFGGFEALRASLERQGRKLEFAMNAGMFHPDFRAVGLLVVEGRTLGAINRSSGFGNFFLQPNGVFLVDSGGARVLPTHAYRRDEPRLATQSGPMLVDRGLIPDIVQFRPASTSRYIRNGVCAPAPGRVAFVISDQPVNFFEFAQVFRDTLGCRDALYLDGTISSLYAPRLRRADHHAKLGPMFAVTR